LSEKVADPNFYKGTQEQIDSVMQALGESAKELETAYARWEELEG